MYLSARVTFLGGSNSEANVSQSETCVKKYTKVRNVGYRAQEYSYAATASEIVLFCNFTGIILLSYLVIS